MVYVIGGVIFVVALTVAGLALYGKRSIKMHEEMRRDD